MQSGPQSTQPSAVPQQTRSAPVGAETLIQESGHYPVPGVGGQLWASAGIAKAMVKTAIIDCFIVDRKWSVLVPL